VPAIVYRGLPGALHALTSLGYDCRWTIVSAGELGAPTRGSVSSSWPGERYPTPIASHYGRNVSLDKNGRVRSYRPSLNTMAKKNLWRVKNQNPVHAGGPLNPKFVEWLMGFPFAWTALDAWETPSFPRKPGKHS
jgi:ribosomal protein S30